MYKYIFNKKYPHIISKYAPEELNTETEVVVTWAQGLREGV